MRLICLHKSEVGFLNNFNQTIEFSNLVNVSVLGFHSVVCVLAEVVSLCLYQYVVFWHGHLQDVNEDYNLAQ